MIAVAETMPELESADRRAVRTAGVLYLATFAFSIPAAFALYRPLVDHPARFVLGRGGVDPVLWGAASELLMAFACVGTAVALYPTIRRHGPVGSIGFVASRVVEASMILIGVVAVLAAVSLRRNHPGGEVSSVIAAVRALMGIKDASFLIGPGFLPVVNALCLAPILLRARLVPRAIPVLGLVGAPLLLASSTATLFGLHAQDSATAGILVVSIFLWELSLGLWLTARGFAEPGGGQAA